MELNQFLHKKITEYIDEVVSSKKAVTPNVIRDEEIDIFTNSRDYESEIRKYLRENKFHLVKKVYREVLDKFVQTEDKEQKQKASETLDSITKLVKEHIKEYNQDLMLKPEFEDYEKLTDKSKKLPDKVSGKGSDVEFFDNNKTGPDYGSAVEAPLTKQQKQQLQNKSSSNITIRQFRTQNEDVVKMINLMKSLELQFSEALINQNVKVAEDVYNKMKNVFSKFPDDEYESKVDMYSNLLSANFRLHELISHVRRLKQNEKQNLALELENTKLKKAQMHKLKLEQERINNHIQELNKKTSLIKKPNVPERSFKNHSIEENSKQDNKKNNITKNRSEDFSEEKIRQLKREALQINHNKNNKKQIEPEKENYEKTKTIEHLYREGLKVLYHYDKKDAKKYFEKILEINPHYKPAIIRLKSIT